MAALAGGTRCGTRGSHGAVGHKIVRLWSSMAGISCKCFHCIGAIYRTGFMREALDEVIFLLYIFEIFCNIKVVMETLRPLSKAIINLNDMVNHRCWKNDCMD